MVSAITRGPRRFTPAELARVEVKIVSTTEVECDSCGATWQATHYMPGRGNYFYRYYWRCPRGCNTGENHRGHPNSFSPVQLDKVGITIINPLELQCQICGQTWNALEYVPEQGHQLKHGYWHCPQGCNVTDDDEE